MFGLTLEDNHISKNIIGDKMLLKPRRRGSCVMEVEFVGGEKTVITF